MPVPLGGSAHLRGSTSAGDRVEESRTAGPNERTVAFELDAGTYTISA